MAVCLAVEEADDEDDIPQTQNWLRHANIAPSKDWYPWPDKIVRSVQKVFKHC